MLLASECRKSVYWIQVQRKLEGTLPLELASLPSWRPTVQGHQRALKLSIAIPDETCSKRAGCINDRVGCGLVVVCTMPWGTYFTTLAADKSGSANIIHFRIAPRARRFLSFEIR